MNRIHRAALTVLTLFVPAAGLAQQAVQIPARDRVLQGKPQTLFAIGALEGADWETFGDVAQVAFDAHDNLYVLDRGNHRVLVFDAQGQFIRQLGKQGGGPGEFGAPNGSAIEPDGRVIVADATHRNYTIFSPDGEFERTVPYDQAAGMLFRSIQGHPRGGVLVEPAGMRFTPEGPQPYDSLPVLWIRPGADDAAPVRLAAVPAPEARVTRSGSAGEMRVSFSGPPTFTPQLRWGPLPDGGLALTHEADYRVHIAGPDGKVQRVIERPFRPRKVTERDKQSARERRRTQLARGIGIVRVTSEGGRSATSIGGRLPEEQIRQNLANMEFAETVPVIFGLRTDPLGRIWVHRTAEKEYGPGRIDLLAADGRYIGTLTDETMPDAVSATGRAAYIERDEFDVERVVVKMLPAGWR